MLLSLQHIRRLTAEVLAAAVLEVIPNAVLIEGDSTSIGFFYDFQLSQPLNDNILHLIEEKMRGLIKERWPIKFLEMVPRNAAEFFLHHDQNAKAVLAGEQNETLVSLIQFGDFQDLCPQLPTQDTSAVGAFKLHGFSHTESNLPNGEKVRTIRIEGTAFPEKSSLKQFLKRMAAAKKRDFRKIGQKLKLFTSIDSGTLWLPRGEAIRSALHDWWRREHRFHGFQLISSPNFDHIAALQAEIYSYHDLPIRYAEWSEQDLAHVFCAKEQALQELISSLQFIKKRVNILAFECQWHLCKKSDRSPLTKSQWKAAERQLIEALNECEIPFSLDEQTTADEGPRVNCCFIDALGREWIGPHVGIDVFHPKHFDLQYQGRDGVKHLPVMISRSLFGSLERVIALLIENYCGDFPFWLSPEQARVLPIGEENTAYAKSIVDTIAEKGYRVGIDASQDKLREKMHRVKQDCVPFALIIGDREKTQGVVTVCSREEDTRRRTMTLDDFLELLPTVYDHPL